MHLNWLCQLCCNNFLNNICKYQFDIWKVLLSCNSQLWVLIGTTVRREQEAWDAFMCYYNTWMYFQKFIMMGLFKQTIGQNISTQILTCLITYFLSVKLNNQFFVPTWPDGQIPFNDIFLLIYLIKRDTKAISYVS